MRNIIALSPSLAVTFGALCVLAKLKPWTFTYTVARPQPKEQAPVSSSEDEWWERAITAFQEEMNKLPKPTHPGMCDAFEIRYYRLGPNHEMIPVRNALEWARYFEKDRQIALDSVGPFRVSTIFLGYDHGYSFLGGGRNPLFFETMTFDDSDRHRNALFKSMMHSQDLIQERWSTYEEAMQGHARIVADYRRIVEEAWQPSSSKTERSEV